MKNIFKLLCLVPIGFIFLLYFLVGLAYIYNGGQLPVYKTPPVDSLPFEFIVLPIYFFILTLESMMPYIIILTYVVFAFIKRKIIFRNWIGINLLGIGLYLIVVIFDPYGFWYSWLIPD